MTVSVKSLENLTNAGKGRPLNSKNKITRVTTKTMSFAIPLEFAVLLEGVQGSKSAAVAEALRMYFRLETKATKKRFRELERQDNVGDEE